MALTQDRGFEAALGRFLNIDQRRALARMHISFTAGEPQYRMPGLRAERAAVWDSAHEDVLRMAGLPRLGWMTQYAGW